MPPHRHGHLLAPVLLVHEQHVQHVVGAEQRVDSMVTVVDLLEIDHPASLFGELVDQVHHLQQRHRGDGFTHRAGTCALIKKKLVPFGPFPRKKEFLPLPFSYKKKKTKKLDFLLFEK